jgi:hypothetical protein
MAEESGTTSLTLKLRRLWKGTLYIGIIGTYAFLLGMFLIYQGWRSALLVLFLIGLGQWFRHIAGDVDRLGWIMREKEPSEEQTEEKRYQTKMHILLVSLIQLLNIAIICQTYAISTWRWALPAAMAILMVEIMFGQIRGVNRRIDYESASYGIKDYGPLTTGASTLMHKEIDGKLDRLQKMAEGGEISQKAYEKVRDRALIKRIMDE